VAHAAELNGWDFTIFSRKQKSQLFGAQYLHHAIPELDCGMPNRVEYRLRGTAEQYRHKVYGALWDGTTSPEDYIESHYAWDIRVVYQQLWYKYQDYIVDCDLSEGLSSSAMPRVIAGADEVVSTLPRKLWANRGDVFKCQKIWALGDGDYKRVHLYRPEPFNVVCSGLLEDEWYRVSNIYGYSTMEWPCFGTTPPIKGASIVEKPLEHNSRAASNFVHLGRYGEWRKGVLTTDAFFDAVKLFS
jgi:hypothetical protein